MIVICKLVTGAPMDHLYGIVKSNLFFLYSNYKNKNFISKQAWASSNAIKINKEMAFLPLAGQCWIITIPYLQCHTGINLVNEFEPSLTPQG